MPGRCPTTHISPVTFFLQLKPANSQHYQHQQNSEMQSTKKPRRKNHTKSNSVNSSLTDQLITTEFEDNLNLSDNTNTNPRSFPYSVKQECWEKAEKIKGRDPQRWRRDPLGNTLFRKLVGCPGCLCHDYDHILPFSKGGKSTLDNCQVLQATVNRSKGNRTDISKADLIRRSSYCRVTAKNYALIFRKFPERALFYSLPVGGYFSGRDMDLIELSAYGNVRHVEDSGGCRIQ